MTGPQIIGRAFWGARHPDGFGPAPLPAREVWLHHSVTVAPDLVPPFDDDDAAVRTLERIGQQRFGGGISYTFAVTPAGRIYEGHSVGRRGAHTKGRNSVARAIVLVGDYDARHPTRQQLDAVAQLLAHGHRQGWWLAPRLAGGHRDAPGASTACPGRHGAAAITAINALAARLASPASTAAAPPAAATPTTKGGDPMAPIPLPVQPDGRFRATAMAEAGGGSCVGGRSWVTVGSTWGWTDVVITACAHDGRVLAQWRGPADRPHRVGNNCQYAQELPAGTRVVTLEGGVELASTVPAAAIWTLPPA